MRKITLIISVLGDFIAYFDGIGTKLLCKLLPTSDSPIGDTNDSTTSGMLVRQLAQSTKLGQKVFTHTTSNRITSTFSGIRPKCRIPCQNCCCGVIITGAPKRFAHSDLEWPNYDKYRRPSTKDSEMPALDGSYTRKVISYIPVAACLTATLYSTKVVVSQFITSMAPSADVLAMAQAEVKLSGIPQGQMMTLKWRGKPLFIKHRIEADWQTERQTPLSMLRDPERDEDRVIKPEWLVVIGVCTHLGCVPISNAGDYGAYYCPCHGSHYDHSGRIRKGPAPTNLEVPKYVFLNDDTILVG